MIPVTHVSVIRTALSTVSFGEVSCTSTLVSRSIWNTAATIAALMVSTHYGDKEMYVTDLLHSAIGIVGNLTHSVVV